MKYVLAHQCNHEDHEGECGELAYLFEESTDGDKSKDGKSSDDGKKPDDDSKTDGKSKPAKDSKE